MATTKARSVPVILIITKQNVLIWQPLLAAKLFTMDQIDQIEHIVLISNITPPISSDKPAFSPGPYTQAMDFDFEAEINFLPFKLNLGKDAETTCAQHSWFLNIIYDHPEIFSLHDEDLGFCDKIKHTILMTLDKPVYLPHQTIPPPLQGEVYKCLGTWL